MTMHKPLVALVLSLSTTLFACVGGEAFNAATDDSGGEHADNGATTGDGGVVDPPGQDGSQGTQEASQDPPDAGHDPTPEAGTGGDPDGGTSPEGAALDAGHETPDAEPDAGHMPEAGYDGPVCCQLAAAGACNGGVISLCPAAAGGYQSHLSCELHPDSGAKDAGFIACTLGDTCVFNADTAPYGYAGECQGTVVACAATCQ